jgi:acetylornithine deacetylase/succinyl-diaminopimelate desuccinylase-like protein
VSPRPVLMAACALSLLAGAAGVLRAQGAGSLTDRVNGYRAARQPEIVRELSELLAIPNVATDSADIERNAAHLIAMLAKRDIPARVLRLRGSHPAVYGELRVPGATRTIMLYAHFDGQPVNAADWRHPPFDPTMLTASLDAGGVAGTVRANADVGEWRLYARSASDDKGPIVAMLTALDALKVLGERPRVNLKFFFEGGEEAGSTGLGELMSAHAELLRADLWLLCDGPVHASRRPQIVYGVRGVMGLRMTTYGPSRALHSGHYGNWAPNPAAELAELLAGMRDSEGTIRISGFYDDVRPLTPDERTAIAALPPTDSALRQSYELGRTEGRGAIGERIMQPAMNIRGLSAGSVENAANAVPVSASASVDFRLVPDQVPDRVRERVERHLRGLGYHVVHATPTRAERLAHARIVYLDWSENGYAGYRVDAGSPFAKALERVTTTALSAPVLVPMLGGSLPVSIMVGAVGVPMVTLPIVNHDNNQHASNENLRLQNLWDGIALLANVMVNLDREWARVVP